MLWIRMKTSFHKIFSMDHNIVVVVWECCLCIVLQKSRPGNQIHEDEKQVTDFSITSSLSWGMKEVTSSYYDLLFEDLWVFCIGLVIDFLSLDTVLVVFLCTTCSNFVSNWWFCCLIEMTDNGDRLSRWCGNLRQFLPWIVEMAPSDLETQDGHYPNHLCVMCVNGNHLNHHHHLIFNSFIKFTKCCFGERYWGCLNCSCTNIFRRLTSVNVNFILSSIVIHRIKSS